jgi:hypothetical protein
MINRDSGMRMTTKEKGMEFSGDCERRKAYQQKVMYFKVEEHESW